MIGFGSVNKNENIIFFDIYEESNATEWKKKMKT
jgi:hypothetical protein